MNMKLEPLTRRPAWKALTTHHKTVRTIQLRELFAQDLKRGTTMTAEAASPPLTVVLYT
jgi:glucose-6-phosphate isomerase